MRLCDSHGHCATNRRGGIGVDLLMYEVRNMMIQRAPHLHGMGISVTTPSLPSRGWEYSIQSREGIETWFGTKLTSASSPSVR